MNVYLDRFLNMPPTPIPEGDSGVDPEAALAALLDTYDEEGRVNEAGRHAADFLAAGGGTEQLAATLGGALLREDAGFHTIQNVEVGIRQAQLQPDRRRPFLVAAARYLGAHTPTRREAEQTFTIASRLQRGESLHGEAGGEEAAAADD
jgi:hypothetical protein